MKKGLLFALLAVVPVAALAGFSAPPEITIDIARRSVQGSLVGARNSADPSAYISCQVNAISTHGSLNTFCMAYTSANGFVYCWSGAQQIAQAALSASDSSMLRFTWNGDRGGECTSLNVENASWAVE